MKWRRFKRELFDEWMSKNQIMGDVAFVEDQMHYIWQMRDVKETLI